jgi:hypothetical protein
MPGACAERRAASTADGDSRSKRWRTEGRRANHAVRAMVNKLGAAFLRCAVGPLNYAGGCIVAGKIPDGLRELSADSLHGGFKRGLEEAAHQVGVGLSDVERLLPIADVDVAAARLDAAQKAALGAWAMNAGQLGGMLKGVADLTVDGRAPDVSNFLERLSKKVVRDPGISEPLHLLSVEVACWLDIVEHCGDLLADGGVLAKAYQRRRLRRVLVGGVGGAALVGALSVGLWLRGVRNRVDAALDITDPCAALSIDESDLARASAAQRQRAADRRDACAGLRRRDADAREAQRVRDEKVRDAEKQITDRRNRCDGLATRLAGGDILAEDEALAPGKGPLLRRIARRALDRGDLMEADLPCADTPAGAGIAAAFATAVVASPAAWANADDVSDRVRAVLVEHRAELPPSPKQQLLSHADNLVKRAMIQKGPGMADQAAHICKLKDDLGIRGAKFCATLDVLRATGKL